ncbi:eukaryotic translation initiation factor 4 gamma 3 isoform X2 [Latimeria chalumnae]|uniref:eukaryotic translation initiation factor 4 gamma 3 isoform X2 n=1 Tax=Latimeria chalumnae TaxID=7897 RepID=UPI0006D909CC|nr:PREDICTED: eukaryotic translation initiation factor 4 gamma 3 isoform X2 [Latimeria chalumnae]|eukprot:XP_014353787.1 PREDICTED: eukaryotic translation initiation factor 4 gamma 3 isoform X2 [Latimeria chalumnae]
MSLPQKPALKSGSAAGTGPGTGPALPPHQSLSAHPPHPSVRALPAQPQQIARGPVQLPLEADRLFSATAPTVFNPVAAQVARQPVSPASPYTAHEINKGHPNLAATPPGHASSPGLSQERLVEMSHLVHKSILYKYIVRSENSTHNWDTDSKPPYPSGQNAAPTSLVYQAPQTMNAQPQTRPFAAGPRPAHHQFFQRPPLQATRATLQNSSPSIRPGTQNPAAAVYPPNQPIMMVNHLTMPYTMHQSHQYCIPQYRHSAAPYVGPPQQYPVQPPGPSPFYPGPGPGEFPNLYGPPFYPSQPIYQSPHVIVPTPQQLPPAKREKKTIRIRDPNQGGKDITEEIMSGGGGSRNPTPPVGRPTSTPTPPQLPPQVLDHGPLLYGSGESPHLTGTPVDSKQEEKMKQEPVLKSFSPGLQVEKKDQAGQTSEPIILEKPQELPSAGAANKAVSVADSTDRIETTIAKEERTLLSSPVPVIEPSQPSETQRASADLPKELSFTPCGDIPVTASTNLIKEVNGVGEQGAPLDTTVEQLSPELPPLTAKAETMEAPRPEAEVEIQPIRATPSPVATAHSPTQGLSEGEEGKRTSISDDIKETQKRGVIGVVDRPAEESSDSQYLNSRRSPVQVQAVVTAPKTLKKPKDAGRSTEETLDLTRELKVEEEQTGGKVLESEQGKTSPEVQVDREPSDLKLQRAAENGEQETEPLRNGAENISESDSTDATPAATENSTESPLYSFKEEQWKPEDVEGKKQYDREFLLGFQFMPACIQKPEGLPPISDVVLDKINQTKLPMRALDSRMMSRGPDFTPSFADFGRQMSGGRGTPLLSTGARRSQQGQGQRREPRKIITNVSVNDDVQLKKAENAWKPTLKRDTLSEDPDSIKTQELLRKVRSILNKLTPQMFNQLMKQVTDLTVDTEERLKGVIDLVFEKAIDEPSFSVAYANMCRCLTTLKVPMTDKPGSTVNFRKLLLNRCQKEFEKDKADDDVFEKKQKELDAASTLEEKTRLQEELEEAKDKARRRSIGNIKFIGELFKLKMLTEAIMHDCVVKLLKNHDEESLECLCRLLTTIGKDLDFEKAKPRMDQYFNQMEKIVKERKTSSRIRFMLQDVIELRLSNWVSRRADQGPKTIEQIHKEAKIEEQEEQRKVHQQLLSKQEKRPRPGVQRPAEEGWNTVPVSKSSRVIDPSKFPKITKPASDEKIQLVPKAQLGSWGKGSSGGAKASDSDSSRPATSLNRFSALQQPASSLSSSEYDSRRSLSSRTSASREKNDKPLTTSPRLSPFMRGGSSKELLGSQSPEEHRRETPEAPKPAAGSTEERNSLEPEKSRVRENAKVDAPTAPVPDKPALSEEAMEKKSKPIIDEFLHIHDYKEAMQCLEELNSPSMLHVFVRVGVESTLERSQITRDHMGQLLYQLVHLQKLSKEEFFKGFSEILELVDDMAIDIPHIWLYLAELVTPMLKGGGISMKELFIEFSKPLVPVGRAGVLLSEILHLLCKQMSHKKVGALWREADLSWKDFLPEEEDVHNFITEKKLEFSVSDCSSPTVALSKRELSAEELNKWLEKLLIEEKANDEQIFDWVEANLVDFQMSSATFIRALMTAVCKAAIVGECSSCRVDASIIKQRVPVLLKYLESDPERELQALYALQALIVKLDQPPNLLRMFFDCLYDEEVITEDAFYKWEGSKDPAEQNGKGVALKSVTAFFTWLREAEEESEDS